jgi:hypothetical protein
MINRSIERTTKVVYSNMSSYVFYYSTRDITKERHQKRMLSIATRS